MRAVLVTALACAPGCNQILGIGNLHLGDSAGQICYGQTGGLYQHCVDAAPTDTLALAGPLDTGADPRCAVVTQTGGPDLCVLLGSIVSVAGTTVTGTRALVVVAADTLSVDGTLDLSSARGARTGAAASVCRGGNGTSDPGGAGGGGGGSFTVTGGTGSSETGGGAGGPANTVDPGPTVIRGGCAGGTGGTGGIAGAIGGDSGGAVYLISATSISITGAVFASGAGADGGQNPKAGAGGGGSGGLIGLDAPAITVGGIVAANGGGGGEGGSQSSDGDHGDDGETTNYDQRANGGSGGAGTDGGQGGALPDPTGASAMMGSQTGGGGGGGGAGMIWVIGTLTGTKISPVAQLHPSR